MSTFGVNDKEGRVNANGVPTNYHGEESEVITRQDMGDAGGGRHTRGSGNPFNEDLHRAMEGSYGVVGYNTSLIWCVYKGDRVVQC